MLKRVRKEDVQKAAVPAQDPLSLCLECWKAWMMGDSDRDLKAKTMGGLIGNSDGHGVDSHEAQQAHDAQVGAATDAMIDSLKRIHIWALYKSCSIGTPWNFPNADLVLTAAEARDALVEKLKKNVCTSNLF